MHLQHALQYKLVVRFISGKSLNILAEAIVLKIWKGFRLYSARTRHFCNSLVNKKKRQK